MPEALRFEHPDERPLLFFLDSKTNKYPSTTDEPRPHPRLSDEAAYRLRKIILKYGGRVLARDEWEDTDVLIVDEAMEEEYALYYAHQPRPMVKTPEFIEDCYKREQFMLYVQPKRAMSVQVLPKGKKKKWTAFTPQEKDMLCRYIAHKVPENDMGGRRGNKIYQDLVAHAEKHPHSPWALAVNHTWQAWREHYVKKRAEYDPLIDEKAQEEGITSQSKGIYNFDRRKRFQRGVQEREIKSEEYDDDDEWDDKEVNEAVAPVGEGSTSRTLRRTRAHSEEQDEAQGGGGGRGLGQRPAPKRRRTIASQRDSGQEDELGWDPAEQTYQDRMARSSDARPGPENAGPSGSQPTPPPPNQETRASRSSVPAQYPPRSNPRHKKPSTAGATLMSTQQTLVGHASPAQANTRAQQANGIEDDEADDENGSPPPSSRHHATAHCGPQRLRKVDVVVPLRQQTHEPQRDVWERSMSASSDKVEKMLPGGEEEEGSVAQDQEYADVDFKEDAEDGKDTQETEGLLGVTRERSFDAEDDETAEIEPDDEGGSDDETDSADQHALDGLTVEVDEFNEGDCVIQHPFEAPGDEDDEEDNVDIFGARPPAASSRSRRFSRPGQQTRHT